MTEREHEPEEPELRQRTWSERGCGPAARLPEQREAAQERIALQLELRVAAIMQEDADEAGDDAEQHHRLEEAYRGRALPPGDHGTGNEHEREQRQRDPLLPGLEV